MLVNSSPSSTSTASSQQQKDLVRKQKRIMRSLEQEFSTKHSVTSRNTLKSDNNKFSAMMQQNNSNNKSSLQEIFLNMFQQTPIRNPALKEIALALRPIWAKSTWTERIRHLKNFVAYLQTATVGAELPLEEQAVLYIQEKKHLMASSRVTYAKALKATAIALGITATPVLDLFVRAQAAEAAGQPVKQAKPITKQQLTHLLDRARKEQDKALMVCIWLAYKTCSRWSDVANLTKTNFIITSPQLENNEIVIVWGNVVKNTRTKPFQAIGLTVVKANPTDQHLLLVLKEQIRKLKKDQLLCPKTTNPMIRWIQKEAFTRQLGCHSFKRAAIEQLSLEALNGNLDMKLIPLVSKHKDNFNQMPSNFIRYNSNKVVLAKLLGTQKATVLL